MKDVQFSKAIQQSDELYRLTQQATKWLEEVSGLSADRVVEQWDRAPDAGGLVFVDLTLTDFTGSAMARFAREELAQPVHMRGRLNWLWGDLLQTRSHKQLQELLAGDEGLSFRRLWAP
jgi:hypothetical protein